VNVAEGQPVAGAIDLPATSASVTLVISDAAGQPVRTLQLGAQPEGLVPFTWDGLDGDGEAAPPGRYTFGAQYFSGTEAVAADTLLRAPIDSVLFGADGFNVELRGIGELPFTAVREIRNEVTPATTEAAAEADATTD
jgi:flagellar basal-body rod modification protein FlgD